VINKDTKNASVFFSQYLRSWRLFKHFKVSNQITEGPGRWFLRQLA